MLGAGIGFEPAANFQPIDGRQQQIEHDEIGQRLSRFSERLFSRRHASHAKTFLGQIVIDQLQQILFVVDHQNPLFCHQATLGHGSACKHAHGKTHSRVMYRTNGDRCAASADTEIGMPVIHDSVGQATIRVLGAG